MASGAVLTRIHASLFCVLVLVDAQPGETIAAPELSVTVPETVGDHEPPGSTTEASTSSVIAPLYHWQAGGNVGVVVIVGVTLGVSVIVPVAVSVGVAVGVIVGVVVGVSVPVLVGVAVAVAVLVGVAVGVKVTVGVCVGVAVAVLVGVTVGD